MKLASIFFTASEAIFEKTSNIAISERESSLSEWVKFIFTRNERKQLRQSQI